jgi:hypothetical protein
VPKKEPVIYVIETDSDPKYYKIGYAQDPNRRISELQVGCPFDLKVVTTVPGDIEGLSPREFERMIHGYLAEHKARGEWFHASDYVEGVVEVLVDGKFLRKFVDHMIMDRQARTARLLDKVLKLADKKIIDSMPD